MNSRVVFFYLFTLSVASTSQLAGGLVILWKMRNPSLKVDALESYLGNHSLSFSTKKKINNTLFLYRALTSKEHPSEFLQSRRENLQIYTGPSQLRVREGLVVGKMSRPLHRYSFPVGLVICALQWDPPIWESTNKKQEPELERCC